MGNAYNGALERRDPACPSRSDTDEPELFRLRDREPYDRYSSILRNGGWLWDEPLHGWLIADYLSASAILSDEDAFAFPPDLPEGTRILHGRRGIFMLEGDTHREFHRFLARRLNRLAGPIRSLDTVLPVVEQTVAGLAHSESVEIFAELAQRIPIRVISGLLGLPWSDDGLMRDCLEWIDLIAYWIESYGLDSDGVSNALEAAAQLEKVLTRHINDASTGDPYGLISGIRDLGNRFYDDWTELDTLSHAKLLLLAGSHTTTGLISSAIAALARDEDLQMWVRANPEQRLPIVVEEFLRLQPPVHVKARTARVNTIVRDREIAAGTRVYVLLAAANRDPAKFPSEGNIDRSPHRGHPEHLSFNIGARFCVGAGLARAEALQTMKSLFELAHKFELDIGKEPPKLHGLMLRSLRPVHIRLHV